MKRWLIFNCIDDEFELVDTEEKADSKAREILSCYANIAHVDGWPDGIEGSIGYARVQMSTKITKIEKVELVVPL